MGLGRSAQIAGQRNQRNAQFLSDSVVPTAANSATNALESFGTNAAISNLRGVNSDATQSRMQLNDVASSGINSLASKQKSQSNPNSTDTWSKYNEDLTNQALNARQVAGTQDINLSVRKANEVDPLAIRNQVGLLTKTNAANFPYQKYGTESQLLNSSGQGILNSGDIQTYTNAATASTPKQYVSF